MHAPIPEPLAPLAPLPPPCVPQLLTPHPHPAPTSTPKVMHDIGDHEYSKDDKGDFTVMQLRHYFRSFLTLRHLYTPHTETHTHIDTPNHTATHRHTPQTATLALRRHTRASAVRCTQLSPRAYSTVGADRCLHSDAMTVLRLQAAKDDVYLSAWWIKKGKGDDVARDVQRLRYHVPLFLRSLSLAPLLKCRMTWSRSRYSTHRADWCTSALLWSNWGLQAQKRWFELVGPKPAIHYYKNYSDGVARNHKGMVLLTDG